MQAPPPMRKGPYLKVLSNVHKEQIARLQAKNQHECDLLEDIRSFTKQRSAIEKSYAEALLKVSVAYLNKKMPSIPDFRDEDGEEQWNVWNVWRTVLEENEKLAKARLAACEVFQQQITDEAKLIRQLKLSHSKKFLDQLSFIQKELQYSVAELDRTKKMYFEEEHLAHDVRDKARDVEEKMKKKKGSIFSTLTSLKRESVKVSSKKEVCEEKSTGARNDYLIALAIANAHSDHYYNVDLDGTLKNLENDVYNKLKEYLIVLSRTELLTCSAAQNSFSKIKDQAQNLTREYNVSCCVQYYPVLKQHIRYPFEPCDGDNTSKITCDHGAAAILSREAKRWAGKIAKEVKTAKESHKKLAYLQQSKDAGNKADPDDPNGPDLDTKMDELKEIIRRAMTEKAKAEGVIECLRDGGVNVDEWMQDIEQLVLADLARSASNTSVKSEDSRDQRPHIDSYYDSEAEGSENREGETSSAEPPERDEDIEAQIESERKKIEALSAMTWDDPMAVDWGDAAAAAPEEHEAPPPPETSHRQGSWPNESQPEVQGVTKCVAIYTYTASNPDELSIVENEHLELLDGEADEEGGWVRARNYKGEEGYVPQNYVEVEGEVDYHVQEKSAPMDAIEETRKSISNGYMDQNEDENQNIPQEGTPTVPTSVSSGLTTPFINELRAGDVGEFCRALYDYEATAPEELSFGEGQIIKVLRRDEDGWWEGEVDGATGLFPEIVVEECRWDGEPLSPMDEDDEIDEDEVSESGIQPPCYTPPEIPTHLLPPDKVVVTQPTPEIERSEEEEIQEPEEAVVSEPPSTEPPLSEQPPSSDIPQMEIVEETIEEEKEVPQIPTAPEVTVTVETTSFGFEMELSNDKQQQYQAAAASVIITEPSEPHIFDDETPGITVTIDDEDGESQPCEDNANANAGLDVAQIVITAATPMTDDHVPLPGEGKRAASAEPAAEGDVAEAEPDAKVSEEASPKNLPEEAEEGLGEDDQEEDGGWAAFEDNFSHEHAFATCTPRVVEVEVKDSANIDSANIEPKKASLEIDEGPEKARISLGESNESPVTPEELDVHNLSKLESLKESDA